MRPPIGPEVASSKVCCHGDLISRITVTTSDPIRCPSLPSCLVLVLTLALALALFYFVLFAFLFKCADVIVALFLLVEP